MDSFIKGMESIHDYKDIFGSELSFGPDRHHGSTRSFLTVVKERPMGCQWSRRRWVTDSAIRVHTAVMMAAWTAWISPEASSRAQRSWLRRGDISKTLSDAGVEGRVQPLVSVCVAATRAPSVGCDRFRNIQHQCQVRGHSQQPDLFGDKGPVGTLAIALIRQR